jgi:hypothetical protein
MIPKTRSPGFHARTAVPTSATSPATWDVGGSARWRGITAGALEEVGAIQRSGANANEHLVLARERPGDVTQLENVGTAGAGDDYCAHAGEVEGRGLRVEIVYALPSTLDSLPSSAAASA